MVELSAPGLRERKKAKLRNQIIDVANALFLEHGFDAVTLERVATDCDISVRTILRYFDSKEAVALVRERDRLGQFAAGIDQRDGDAVAFWRQFVAVGVDALSASAESYREHLVMIFRNRSLFAELLAIQHAFEDVLAAAIDQDNRGANPLAARLLATVLVGGNAATVRQWVAGDVALDPRVLLDVVDYTASAFRLSEVPMFQSKR
jgi:AcrR family transcriptional regulator